MPLGTLFIFSAPSGAGKTTLVKQLLSDLQNIEASVSYTTRTKRAKEKSGVDYNFISKEAFAKMQQENAFLESALVFGSYYGTALKSVEEKLEKGIDVVLVIDWQGARQIREKISDAKSIFILPPSKKELRNRLTKRAQDSDDVIAARMDKAKREMSHYSEYDYLVVNDSFQETVNKLKAIVIAERLRCANKKEHLEALVNDLLR